MNAVSGGEQGMRGGRGPAALFLNGQVLGKAVVGATGPGGVEEAGALKNPGRLVGAAQGEDQPGPCVPGDGDVVQDVEVGFGVLHRNRAADVRAAAGAGGADGAVAVGVIRPEGCWSAVAMPWARSCRPASRTARACSTVSSPDSR